MTRTRPRLFYGWWVVLASALGLFLGPIPIVIFSFGVFLKPLAQEFHAGRATISLAFSLHSTVVAFALLFAGPLIDRFGAKRVILPSLVFAGSILVSAYFCSDRLWQLYLFYAASGIASSGASPVPYSDLISHWFDRYRGLALGCTMFGLGAGALVMPSTAQFLITKVGWRLTFATVGAAILVITVPGLTIFLKDRPEPMGLLPDGSPPIAAESRGRDLDMGLNWREAWRAPTFWLLFCAFVLISASVQGCLTHIAAILADRGIPAQAAALATSLFGAGLLLGRVGSGFLLDRFFAPRVASAIFGCAAAGIGLLRLAGSPELAFLAAFFVGIGLGAEVDVMAYLISRYFGLRCFGAIYGFAFAGFGLAGGLGTYLMGAAFDVMGSYHLALALFCIATFIGAALMLRLGPYLYHARPLAASLAESQMLPSES